MRNKRLDVLRALAVLLVLGRHVDKVAIWTKVGYAVYVSLSLFVGIVLSLLIEFPALRLREHLFPAPTSVAKTASSAVSFTSAPAQP